MGLAKFFSRRKNHRIVPNFKAQGEGISSLAIIGRLLSEVKASTDGKIAR